MAYYLTIKEKNNLKLLDVSNLDEFTRLSKYKGGVYSLEEIDLFTECFDDEIELKRRLYENGIIEFDDITKEITIRIKRKGEYIKVMYEPVYGFNKKYIDIFYVRSKFLELQNDRVFLNKLLNRYRHNYRQDNLTKIRAILNGYSGDDINMFEALSCFFNEEIFEMDYSTGESKVKYKSFHDLAMFVYNYLEKKEKNTLDLQTEEETRILKLQELKDSLTPKVVYVKKKTKKNRTEIDGQLSFMD